jgi:hypothetical protein
MGKGKPQLFFILGRPRSGTTLLRTILDAHPQVKVPPEYPVVLQLYRKYGEIRQWNEKTLEEFKKDFRSPLSSENWKYEFLRIDERQLDLDLKSLLPNTTFEEVFKCFYVNYTSVVPGKEIITHIGDKNPIFATQAFRLRKIFPEARFIFIFRDYRDNFLSVKKFQFEAPIIALQAYRWKYVAQLAYRFIKEFPDQSLIIHYEDLTKEPEKILNQICNFLGIPYDGRMLDYSAYSSKYSEFVDPALLHQFHSGLQSPIQTSSSGKWMKEMRYDDIKTADQVVGRFAEYLGYQRVSKKFHPLIWIKTTPWQLYGFFLYQMMALAEFLPASLRQSFSMFLPKLAHIYHKNLKKQK